MEDDFKRISTSKKVNPKNSMRSRQQWKSSSEDFSVLHDAYLSMAFSPVRQNAKDGAKTLIEFINVGEMAIHEVEEMFERIISKGRRLEDLIQKKLDDLKDNHKFRGGLIDQGVGSTSGIRACALRYFDLEVMELENTQNNALAKLPMLKLGEYEMWEIRIKQYFQIQDYALWEVIENGNSWVPIPVTAPESGPSIALKMTVPSTAKEKTCKKNDVKARSLLLMALPNEHHLTFDQYVDV
ncbi:hypothetical protein Tco_0345254 [Tanacetum coccineum]